MVTNRRWEYMGGGQLFFDVMKGVPFSCTKFGGTCKGSSKFGGTCSFGGSGFLTMFLQGKCFLKKELFCTLKENSTMRKRDPILSNWFWRGKTRQKGTRFHHICFLKEKRYFKKKDPFLLWKLTFKKKLPWAEKGFLSNYFPGLFSHKQFYRKT